jgi:GDSL-like Lipase/Acylhydrolase family
MLADCTSGCVRSTPGASGEPGVSGANSADVVRDHLPAALAMQPHLVTLSVGLNDIAQRKDVRECERNVEMIVETLSRQSHTIVLTTLLPGMVAMPFWRGAEPIVGPQTAEFNEVLKSKGRNYSLKGGVEVVDLYSPTRKELSNHPALLAADGYHPSDQGYAGGPTLSGDGWRPGSAGGAFATGPVPGVCHSQAMSQFLSQGSHVRLVEDAHVAAWEHANVDATSGQLSPSHGRIERTPGRLALRPQEGYAPGIDSRDVGLEGVKVACMN